jgi:hypothetical protein
MNRYSSARQRTHPRLVTRLGLMFDLLVRVERKTGATNALGQQVSGTSVVPALNNIPAQRQLILTGGEEIQMADGTVAVAKHVWTLQGTFDIKPKTSLIQYGQNGATLGSYSVLTCETDPLGLTLLKTTEVR